MIPTGPEVTGRGDQNEGGVHLVGGAQYAEPPRITLDGKSATGKSTVAEALGRHFGLPVIDMGTLMRTFTYVARETGLGFEPGDDPELSRLGQRIEASFNPATGDLELELDGCVYNSRVLHNEIRSKEITDLTKKIAWYEGVEQTLLEKVRALGKDGCVAVGRQMALDAFPSTRFKYFLDADSERRAERRLTEDMHRAGDFNAPDPAEIVRMQVSLDSRDQSDLVQSGVLQRLQEAGVRTIDTTEESIPSLVDIIAGEVEVELAGGSEPSEAGLPSFRRKIVLPPTVWVSGEENVDPGKGIFLSAGCIVPQFHLVPKLTTEATWAAFSSSPVEAVFAEPERPDGYDMFIGVATRRGILDIRASGTTAADLWENLDANARGKFAADFESAEPYLEYLRTQIEYGFALTQSPSVEMVIRFDHPGPLSGKYAWASQSFHSNDQVLSLQIFGEYPALVTPGANIDNEYLTQLASCASDVFSLEAGSSELIALTEDWGVLRDPKVVGQLKPFGVLVSYGLAASTRLSGRGVPYQSGVNFRQEPFSSTRVETTINFLFPHGSDLEFFRSKIGC